MKHLFIATPSFDGKVTVEYHVSVSRLEQLCHENGIQTEKHFISCNALVHDARNRLVAAFLRSSADRILFVDADIGFDPQAVFDMVSRGEDVIGGAYPRKTHDDNISFNFATQGDVRWTGSLMEVDYLGAGLLKISRGAVLRMIERWPDRRYADPFGNEVHALFDTDMTGGKVQGEDAVFMRRWKECGGTVWCAPDIMFSHTGMKIWAGNFWSVLKPALEAEDAA